MSLHRLNHFLFGTLRGRLILSVATVHAVMMSLFIVDLTQRQRKMLLEQQEEQANTLAHTLATTAAGWLAAHDLAGLQELVDAQRQNPELVFAILADQQGRILAHTDRSKNGKFLLDLPREARPMVYSKTVDLADVISPVFLVGRPVGWTRIGLVPKMTGAKLEQITRNGVGYALGAIVIGSVIAWFMGRRMTRRLYAVQDTFNAVRSGDPTVRAQLTGDDEAAEMAREFNAMLDALAQRTAEGKMAEANLRESEERFRSVVEGSSIAVFVTLELKFTYLNPAALRLLGATAPGQILGQPVLSRIHPDYHAIVRQRAARVEQERMWGAAPPLEEVFLRLDGTPVPVEVTATPISYHGQPGAVVFLQDITARKQTEVRIAERTMELETANQALAAVNTDLQREITERK